MLKLQGPQTWYIPTWQDKYFHYPQKVPNSVSFVGDCPGLISVYFLKNKYDAAAATAKFLADMAPYGDVKCIRSDNGDEYTCSDFKNLLPKYKIKHEFLSPLFPHQKVTAERAWRTLFNAARSVLLQANQPKHLWNYAGRHVALIQNRCFS